jgi:tetratricopeptide (TPR) repeat protein
LALNRHNLLSVKKLTIFFSSLALLSAAGVAYELKRINEVRDFNRAVLKAESPKTDRQSFEAKFSTAYWLAKNERYKEATLLFTQLLPDANPTQKSAIQYNLGNIFFRRGLAINGTNMTVRDEAEYLLRQAKSAYVQSLKYDNSFWDARHNLDRVLTMLPATPTPGVGESDTPGLIMGNIPVGLP